jgi:hypothetical protein
MAVRKVIQKISSIPEDHLVDDSELIGRLHERIAKLEQEIKESKQDGQFALYFALNRKANQLAALMNEATLSLTSEDKGFDRFLKLIEKMDVFTSSLLKLRQNYLRLDEVELKEIENKGIPLLEQRAAKKQRK